MKTTINLIREKLHYFIDHAEEEKVKAFYTIMQPQLDQGQHYSKEFEKELDSRIKRYKSGESKHYTAEESVARIQKILKKKK